MKVNLKKLLSVLASIILISAMFPIVAVASENSHTTKTKEEEETIASSAPINDDEVNHNDSLVLGISNIINTTPTNEPSVEELSLFDELDDEREILYNRGQRSNVDEEYNINKDSFTERKEQSRLRSQSVPSTLSNTDPNSAIYLPENYFGQVLSDIADENAHWYCFETAGNNKVTIAFSQQPYGDYDIRLYKLDGTTLNMVDFSQNIL